MTKSVVAFIGLVSLLVWPGSVPAQDVCVQDDYGNRYDIYADPVHTYIYGTVNTSASGCDATSYYLLGSYANDLTYELTAVNPLGDADTQCFATWKIKGVYPSGAWYYVDGYGGQEFFFNLCTPRAVVHLGEGGPRRPQE